MIYNQRAEQDYNNILRYIDDFTSSFRDQLSIDFIQIDTSALTAVCSGIRQKFPHIDGFENASAFKKVAYFVAHFMSRRPIRTKFSIIDGISEEKADINAVVAFDIAIACLEGSKIVKKDGTTQTIEKNIYLSDHSYKDIIEALSVGEICPKHHYHILTVFFEQLVYKTNPECQYSPDNPAADGSHQTSYYGTPFSVTDGDDLMGN